MSTSQNITYVGLDAHAKSIHVAVILPGSRKVDEQWQIEHNAQALKRLAKKLLALAPGAEVHAAYEAGPCGYALQRTLEGLGIRCSVIAPSLIPIKPGERVKTDRKDARKLATLLRGEELTEVHPPTPAEEALRDLTRAREDAKEELMAARHRLTKMLLRYGLKFTGTKNWTQAHRAWLKGLRFEYPHSQQSFDLYLLAIEQIEARVAAFDAHLKEAAKEEPWATLVGYLRCLRGIDTVVAMTLVAELHDFRRFQNPRQLMGYLGLTPSETSSGNSVRRGPITKTGNSHVRQVLTESAWSYRHRPSVSGDLRRRREGQPPEVIALADQALIRLHRRYVHLWEKRLKPHNVVVVAISRELVGFIWALAIYAARITMA